MQPQGFQPDFLRNQCISCEILSFKFSKVPFSIALALMFLRALSRSEIVPPRLLKGEGQEDRLIEGNVHITDSTFVVCEPQGTD